ncbi:helix-turn-helix domain-containing protein [Gordonia rubripertincta]|uniref:Helix-turn-helix domain-containing protein n=2 Tax=Gordonia rubripertincta TaxID=36822 RepID=A0AAW6R8L2_GORRU|nr:helix-turn-helix domain-containing protein [Gordonia rubripertincta]MDG6780881.1 helix-turn-helix domain-containing protein [Gordonia rubripertincta]GAB83712.1 putative HxlR family transcriptional regulator [Gordonia rubripertincta NBRC 101908]
MPETPTPASPSTAPTSTPSRADHELSIDAASRELLGQVLDKWSLSVLNELCEAPSRFNELRRAIPAVSQKSLTSTLRRLERNGIVERRTLSTRPVSVEYRITPLGKTVREPIDGLLGWAATHLPAIDAARQRFDDEVLGLGVDR